MRPVAFVVRAPYSTQPLPSTTTATVLQGVGVGLFRDRACAVEACNKLSGAQADGRKLELVLMNPDNHVSFSCRQVRAGLFWMFVYQCVVCVR
jgi:hypothetical protein